MKTAIFLDRYHKLVTHGGLSCKLKRTVPGRGEPLQDKWYQFAASHYSALLTGMTYCRAKLAGTPVLNQMTSFHTKGRTQRRSLMVWRRQP